MFLGTTVAPIRSYLHSVLQGRKYERIFEPFAGNFAFTQVARKAVPGAHIISGDISVYSVMLGHGLHGDPVQFEVSKWLKKNFPLSTRYTDRQRAAYILFLSDIAKFALKMDKVEYARRMIALYQAHQKEAVNHLAAKIEAAAKEIGDNWEFRPVDAAMLLQEVRAGDLVFYDPPYWVGGYEKMFAFIDANLKWDRPAYTVFDDKKKVQVVAEIIDQGATVFWRTEKEIEVPNLRKVFEYHHRVDGAIYLYTNDRTFKPAAGSAALLSERDPRLPIITPSDELQRSDPVRMVEIDRQRFNHYRQLWTKKSRMKSAEDVSYAVFVGEKLVAVAGVECGMRISSNIAVIVSDAAPPSSYKRLSRLVLYILLTDEMLQRVNRKTLWDHIGYTTKVYTDAPVSMKYRGLFDLANRKKGKYLAYELTYSTKKMVASTVQEAYVQWWDRYGDQRTDQSVE